MDAERFRRAKELLLRALDVDPSERDRWLERACEGDTELKREVESLLAQDQSPVSIVEDGVLTTSAGRELGAALDTLAARAMPSHIGPYEIVGVLGEGGMGVVYHGRQREPIERDVAVKVIRRGMDSERVLARFEWERRSLARMDHPHITGILDAGTDERGQPYVAMPLIRGLPVTRFCDENKLDPLARVKLFLRICHAVDHAHGRGILHRDLKPSNILVREGEGEPTPSVIDFGIAKALDLDTDVELTLEGQRIGTPAYMSPEQLRSGGGDADVRSDVYALGVILYELLSGRHPMGDRVDEVTRQIAAGAEPTGFPSPSTALSQAEDTASVAASRGVTTRRLRQVLRGDLDTICLAATRTDPQRRYASVGHLVDDLERYLDGRPVLARPDSWSYRFGKFARRHAVGVTVAAALLVLTLAGGVFLAFYADRVGHERDRARLAEAQARLEADANAEIVRFLEELFTELDPEIGSAADATAREVLAAGAQRVRTELVDQPMARARLYRAIGITHHGISALPEAKQLAMEGRALLDSLGPDADPALVAMERGHLESLLGTVCHDLGEFEEGERHDRASVAAYREAGERGRKSLGAALSYLAVSVQAQGRLDEALPLLEESISISREFGPEGARDATWAQNVLGYCYYQLGRLREAVEVSESALRAQRENPEVAETDLIDSLNNLSGFAKELGDRESSRRYAAEALQIARETFSNIDHPSLSRALSAVARLEAESGHFERARRLADEAYQMNLRSLGPDHRNTLRGLSSVAMVEEQAGDFERAIGLQARVLSEIERTMGESGREADRQRQHLLRMLVEAGRWDEASKWADRVVEEHQARYGERNFQTAVVHLLRARLRSARGDADGAQDDLRRAQPVLEATFEPEHEHRRTWRRIDREIGGSR